MVTEEAESNQGTHASRSVPDGAVLVSCPHPFLLFPFKGVSPSPSGVLQRFGAGSFLALPALESLQFRGPNAPGLQVLSGCPNTHSQPSTPLLTAQGPERLRAARAGEGRRPREAPPDRRGGPCSHQ